MFSGVTAWAFTRRCASCSSILLQDRHPGGEQTCPHRASSVQRTHRRPLRGGTRRRHPTGDRADRKFIVESYKKCKQDKDCIKTRIKKMVEVDPLGSVLAVLSMFDNRETMHSECHWSMHLIGQILKPRTLAGDRLDLGRYWISCNAAILHGAYENSELAGTPAEQGEEAYRMCFSLDNSISGHCMHPIGHTLAINLPAEGAAYMQRAEYACAAGAWAVRETWKNPAIFSACLNGVHMNYRDNYLKDDERILHPGESVESAFPQCAASLFPWGCAFLYYEATLFPKTDQALTDAKRIFTYCRDSDPLASGVCAYFFGLAIVVSYLHVMSPDILSHCIDRSVFTEQETNICLMGVLDEYDNEVVQRKDIEERFCAVIKEIERDCAPILYKTAITYPWAVDPATLEPSIDVLRGR